MSIYDNGIVLTYIDGAYALYDYGKGLSGLFVAMWLGAIINASTKLGLETTS